MGVEIPPERLIKFTADQKALYTSSLDKRRAEYRVLLEEPAAYTHGFWDVVVVTAIDELQKEYYEHQIEQKKRKREIPLHVRYMVVPDPPGARIGCGGSTLYVLDLLEKEFGSKMDEYKVLLIHAGGYSKRLANHTISGKIFCPIPLRLSDACPSITMLELKFILLLEFPRKMSAGVFLTCADDIELFESEGCDFTLPGVTALAHPATTSIGLTHGVFVLHKEEMKDFENSVAPRKCIRFLHKPTLELMKEAGAVLEDQDYEVFVDSNFFFDRSIGKKLLEYYRSTDLDCEIDAYGDFLQPLGEQAVDSYFNNTRTTGSVSAALLQKRKELYEVLHKCPLNVIPFVPSLFIHLGTCKEYIEHMCLNLSEFGFERYVYSQTVYTGDHHDNSKISPKCCVHYSVLSENVTVPDNTVVEYCKIINDKAVKIGTNCILSQIYLPPTVTEILDGVLMNTMVLESSSSGHRFLTLAFGVEDDLKATSQDMNMLSIRGTSMGKILSCLGLQKKDVWDDSEKNPSLWNAKLFPIGNSPEECAGYTCQMLDVVKNLLNGDKVQRVDWSNIERGSVSKAIASKDMHGQSYYFRNKHEQDIAFFAIKNLFKREEHVGSWLSQLPSIAGLLHPLKEDDEFSQKNFQSRLDNLLHYCEDQFKSSPILEQSRAAFSLSMIIAEIATTLAEDHSLKKHYSKWSETLSKNAWAQLRDCLIEPFLPEVSNDNWTLPFLPKLNQVKVGSESTCVLPARIIFAGGWSDTPPFCLEKGGDIVNFAININGKKPISAIARIIDEPVIRLKSVDAGVTEDFPLNGNMKALFNYATPGEPLALHQACVCFTLFPQLCVEEAIPQLDSWKNWVHPSMTGGKGLELITEVDIPKGSGLGTSSILMLACIRALRNLLADAPSSEEEAAKEFNAVLAIEQMLTTGGGWQDQVGGGVPGLKFISAQAGITPKYHIDGIHFSESHVKSFNDRLVVVYTGKTRMAKPILSNIKEHWYMRRPDTVDILMEIKSKATEMHQVFQHYGQASASELEDDYEKLGKILRDVRQLNIDLEKSISNPHLDSLFASIDRFVTGSHIIGAGSGGFICGFLKKGETKENVQEYLKQHHPEAELSNMSLCVTI